MSKKKQRLYNKAKKSQTEHDWRAYKDFQKATQKKQRQYYWSYQNNVFSDPDDKSNKTFWRFIKSKKQDNVSISSLKQSKVDGQGNLRQQGKSQRL